MPALQIKDCPVEVYERLRTCAALFTLDRKLMKLCEDNGVSCVSEVELVTSNLDICEEQGAPGEDGDS